MNYLNILTRSGFLAVALSIACMPLRAQPSPTVPIETVRSPVDDKYEFTLGGSGVSNKDFDDSLGGVSASLGEYVNQQLLVGIRQGINYSNPSNSGSAWNGSTFAFADYNFGRDVLRPFVGANLGGIYGDSIRDSFGAGLEAGAKYYVQPRTFIYAMVQYSWLFRHGKDIDDRFSNGQFVWNVGVGFSF